MRRDDDVLRLHVPVDDAVAVGVLERVEQVVGHAQRVRHRQPAARGQELPQGRALHVGHDVVDQPVALARVEQMRDMGMVELGGELDLPEEPVGRDADEELGVQDLERDRLSSRLPRQEDAGVPALADLALDLVPALEGLADQRQHVAANGPGPCGGHPMVTATPRSASRWETLAWAELPAQGSAGPAGVSAEVPPPDTATAGLQQDVGPDPPPDRPPERPPQIRPPDGHARLARHPGPPPRRPSASRPAPRPPRPMRRLRDAGHPCLQGAGVGVEDASRTGCPGRTRVAPAPVSAIRSSSESGCPTSSSGVAEAHPLAR